MFNYFNECFNRIFTWLICVEYLLISFQILCSCNRLKFDFKMASLNDKSFERQSKHDSRKKSQDFETDSNNNQKKRTRSGNNRDKLPKPKKKRISSSNVDGNSKFLTWCQFENFVILFWFNVQYIFVHRSNNECTEFFSKRSLIWRQWQWHSR